MSPSPWTPAQPPPRPPPGRLRRWRPALLTGTLLGLAALLAWQWPQWQAQAAGAALFDGSQPLVARVQGHDEPLPAAAARCHNCHVPLAVRQAASGAGLATDRFAPLLDRQHLESALARRGGPPSHYDAARLCTLLRSGTDPAWVLLPRTMPRYEISDQQCQALWAHLTRA